MHGTSVLKILFVLWANFGLSKRWAGRKYAVLGTWVFNVLVLVGNEWTGGWRYGERVGLVSLHAFLLAAVHFEEQRGSKMIFVGPLSSS